MQPHFSNFLFTADAVVLYQSPGRVMALWTAMWLFIMAARRPHYGVYCTKGICLEVASCSSKSHHAARVRLFMGAIKQTSLQCMAQCETWKWTVLHRQWKLSREVCHVSAGWEWIMGFIICKMHNIKLVGVKNVAAQH